MPTVHAFLLSRYVVSLPPYSSDLGMACACTGVVAAPANNPNVGGVPTNEFLA
jgi:hypothetical protein